MTTALLTGDDLPARAAEPTLHDGNALAEGTQLGEFEIVRVLGVGGFGIVYLALDRVLLRYVAIKEYLPSSLASRDATDRVTVRSAGRLETFTLGLESFINEARMLASFDHPSLVKVFRFWKANGTAYMAMQYYAGTTLKDARAAMAAPPDAAWLRALIEPLLGALEVLHAEGVYHRDISPDNILLLPEGRPVLLDFGSARRVIGDRTQSLTAILKPNFAPLEQYADEAGMRQGAWTDLFALGATLHYLLTDKTPTPAVMRAIRDELPLIAGSAAFTAEDELPRTIDWMLALAPEDRPQSVAEVRQALAGERVPPARTARRGFEADASNATAVAAPAGEPGEFRPADEAEAERNTGSTAATAVAPASAPAPASASAPAPAPAPAPAAAPPARPRRGLVLAGVALAIVALASIGVALAPRSQADASATPASSVQVEAGALPGASATPPLVASAPAGAAPILAAGAAASTPSDSAPAAHDTSPKSATSKPDAIARAQAPKPANATVAEKSTARAHPAPRAPAEASAPEPAPVLAITPPPVEERRPEQVCAANSFLTRAACIRRECQAPKWRAEAQCIESKALEESQQRRGQS